MSDQVSISMPLQAWSEMTTELETLRQKQKRHDDEREEMQNAVDRMERAIRDNGVLLAWEMRPYEGVYEVRIKFNDELVRSSRMKPSTVVALTVQDKIEEWDKGRAK